MIFFSKILYIKVFEKSTFTVRHRFTMKLFGVILVFLSLALIASASKKGSTKKCIDKCENDFDEVVCASNGFEQRNFSGRCRLKQYNECYDESKHQKFMCKKCIRIICLISEYVEINSSKCRQFWWNQKLQYFIQ